MTIDILTIFPEMFDSVLSASILGRARASGLLTIEATDIRPFSLSKHKNTDDYPFGGGAGMLMMAQPIADAMKAICAKRGLACVDNFSGLDMLASSDTAKERIPEQPALVVGEQGYPNGSEPDCVCQAEKQTEVTGRSPQEFGLFPNGRSCAISSESTFDGTSASVSSIKASACAGSCNRESCVKTVSDDSFSETRSNNLFTETGSNNMFTETVSGVSLTEAISNDSITEAISDDSLAQTALGASLTESVSNNSLSSAISAGDISCEMADGPSAKSANDPNAIRLNGAHLPGGDDAQGRIPRPRAKRIYLSPRGVPLTQKLAQELSQEQSLILLCGHYEGVDQRVLDKYIDLEVSVGDYVLTGGEVAAMVLVDCVARLVPGVLGSEESPQDESFSDAGLLEYPQYTRPRTFEGMDVPDVLLNGDHAKIAAWRRRQSIVATVERRPELLQKAKLTTKEKNEFGLE